MLCLEHKDTQNTYNDLRETAAVIPDSAEDVVCEVDEVPCEYHRARSPLFTIIAKPGALAAPGQFTKPGQSDNAVSDGHWALLEPLPLGKHEIHFSSETSGFFYVDITYNVTIVAEQ